MASRTVTSPAGERLEIVSDDDWCQLVGTTEHGIRQWWGQKAVKPFVIMELWLGGKVESENGRASSILYDRMLQRFPNEVDFELNSIPSLMNGSINDPAFSRVTKGKRTYETKLVALPETWHRKMLEDINDRGLLRKPTGGIITKSQPVIEPDPVETVVPINQVDTDPESPMVILDRIDNVLTFMLHEWQDAMGKLSERLEDNSRLRTKLRESGDEVQALKYERDGLRQRLRATEHNLNVALKGEGNVYVNGEVQRRMDEFIRAIPTPNRKREDL